MINRIMMSALLFALPGAWFQDAITLQTPAGEMEFRKPSVSNTGGSVRIRGELVNRTAIDWDVVFLRLELYGEGGKRISTGADNFPVFNVRRGAVTKVDQRLAGLLKERRIERADIFYDGGQYPADYVFALIKPTQSDAMEHEDAALAVKFSVPEKKQLAFTLRNKTDEPIKIDWDQVSYVDSEGKAHKVVHQGIRYIERDRPMPVTTIPPGSALDDFVYPADQVKTVGGEWTTPMLFPQAPRAAELKGKSFSLFMPLDVGGKTVNYNFIFTIKDVKM